MLILISLTIYLFNGTIFKYSKDLTLKKLEYLYFIILYASMFLTRFIMDYVYLMAMQYFTPKNEKGPLDLL